MRHLGGGAALLIVLVLAYAVVARVIGKQRADIGVLVLFIWPVLPFMIWPKLNQRHKSIALVILVILGIGWAGYFMVSHHL